MYVARERRLCLGHANQRDQGSDRLKEADHGEAYQGCVGIWMSETQSRLLWL